MAEVFRQLRLFVGGLPPDTTSLEMYQIFSAFGPIAPRGAPWISVNREKPKKQNCLVVETC